MSLDYIANKFPSEKDTVHRLDDLLTDSGSPSEFTFERICSRVEPHSREALAAILGELVRSGKMKQILRVTSPARRGGIKDFETFDSIPTVIHDTNTDTDVEVSPENLQILYKL